MPVSLPLPLVLRRARWKVKIQEKECREPPHVSILRGVKKWRIDLRTGEFMDRQPKPAEVPDNLVAVIRDNWAWLCEQWDKKYPDNPVSSEKTEASDGDNSANA